MKAFRNVLMVAIALIIAVQPVLAQEKMEYEAYMAELQRWQNREEVANKEIEALEAEIIQLKADIAALDKQIAGVWDEIYKIAGITKESVKAYRALLDDFQKRINNLGNESPEGIYRRSIELDGLDEELVGLRNRNEAVLTEFVNRLDKMAAQLQSIRGRMAKPRVKTYQVMRGDYLWKIAGMDRHYGDPWKWMRIYSVNLDQIKDPDLIFPDQILSVPMDVDRKNQYLVSKGDYLYGIAEKTFGDPFKWRQIYEANNKLIADPNTIYPEMILSIPGR